MFIQLIKVLFVLLLVSSTNPVHKIVRGFTIHSNPSLPSTSSLKRSPNSNTITLLRASLSSNKVTESSIYIEQNRNYRETYNISDSLASMEKLAHRLHSCGVENFYFANDSDPTDQMAPVIEKDQLDLQKLSPSDLREDKIIHVKTLVWKGIFLRNSSNSKDGDKTNQGAEDVIYFVTALRVEDKVDMGELRKIIKGEMRKKGGQTLILQLAEKERAEMIAGFASGSMPPGWHSVPLKLYIDDYILESFNNNQGPLNRDDGVGMEEMLAGDNVGNNGAHYSKIMMSVGSGSSNYSLHVSLLDTLMSSVYLHDRDQVCEDIGLDVDNLCKSQGRFIVPFTRTRADKRNQEKQKQLHAGNSDRRISRQQQKAPADLSKQEKLTRKLFHVTAKKKGKANEVREMIKILGDEFPSFMRVDTGAENERFASEYNKNGIHYAAWKGDTETVSILINECKRLEGMPDPVNMISTGEGCFGKTPIFYAITQCRDDMVLHLLALGASLLIVNNKGQSPCSLAVNKLKPETCQLMYQTEETQLESGLEFVDYRRSHSDGRRYGDLDPRFLEFGDINMDDDIQFELDQFDAYNSLECEDMKKAMSDSNPFLQHSISERCLPRSVRVTNPAMRQAIRAKDQEERRKKTIGEESVPQTNGLRLLRSVRTTTPIWRQESWIKKQEEKKESPLADDRSPATKGRAKNKSSTATPNHIVELEDGREIDMNMLETLKLEDILQSTSNGEQKTYELIDDDAGILTFEFAIEETLSTVEGLEAQNMNDDEIVKSSWGLDCEWRPSVMSGELNPVATLQLSSSSRSFVIDVQTLCRGGVDDAQTPMNDTERILSDAISQLFSSVKIRIVGFGIVQDLSKLAASFPHIPCFHQLHSVLDLQALSRYAYPDKSKHFMSSLQKASSIILRKRMDKTEQCSEWNARPLRISQLKYASLDATVLPVLLGKMLHKNSNAAKEQGFFLRKNSGIQYSFRFTFLEDDENCGYRIEMGSLKPTLGMKVARQMWPTLKRDPPPLPEKISPHEFQQTIPGRTKVSKKEKAFVKKARERASKVNAIELINFNIGASHTSLTGQEIGYTKDSCIERILGEEVIRSIPEDSYLRYNRRGGMIELGNCWMLFINFTVGRYHEKYRNEFEQNGKCVSFTINPSRFEDGELLQNLLIPEDSSISRKSVLLFIRGSSSEKFICCGKVKCISHKQNEHNDLVDLALEVLEFGTLSDDTSNYMRIVSEHLQDSS